MAPTRKLSRVLSGVVLIVAVLVADAGHAYADPTVSQIETQIDTSWNQLEPIIEQYNQVHSQLLANEARQSALQKQLLPLQLQVDVAMAKVDQMATMYYMSGAGNTTIAILSSKDPADFANKLVDMSAIAHDESLRIATVRKARDQYATKKDAMDTLVAAQKKQDAALAAKKSQIQTQLTALQNLRLQAYGSSQSTGNLKPVACPQTYLPGKGGTAAEKACSLIGHPYGWADAGPKYYDCSGLTMTAWAAAGVSLGHFTGDQWNEGKVVSASDLRPGDLIFFYSDHHHVGIYVGNGWMVHAPTTGDFVRMAKVAGRPIDGYRRPA